MKEFKGKVAVITGAASGIGRGIAERCVREEMKVVLADIDEARLARTATELKTGNAPTLAVKTNVSKTSEVEELAHKTLETFGAVHVLCNNAGVDAGTTIANKSQLSITIPCMWENTLADWQWVMNVNLWGVIHGIRVFVPLMLEQRTECHIINTASMGGLTSGPGFGIYKATKHGVVTLSETLYYELKQCQAKVNVSVLCPGFVKTRIFTSGRNRPAEYQNPMPTRQYSREEEEARWAEKEAVHKVLFVETVAEMVFTAIRNEQLYVLTHPELKEGIRERMENIINELNPMIKET